MELSEEGGGEGVLVEALYIIGRYDILEDHLGLPVNDALHQVMTYFVVYMYYCSFLNLNRGYTMIFFSSFSRGREEE